MDKFALSTTSGKIAIKYDWEKEQLMVAGRLNCRIYVLDIMKEYFQTNYTDEGVTSKIHSRNVLRFYFFCSREAFDTGRVRMKENYLDEFEQVATLGRLIR